MTDEEMAEKYAKGLCKTCKVDVCRYSKIKTCTTKESLKQAYLAGLNDGSCVHYNKWEDYKNPQLTKAKEIIKDYLIIVKGAHTTVCGVPKENRTIYVLKLNEEAEQFVKEND